MRVADLSDKERVAFLRAMRAPALWALNILAAEVGFDSAFEACVLREIPAEAEQAFQSNGYMLRDLPHHDELVQLLLGIRIKLRWRPKKESLQTVARSLGLSVREAQRALSAFEVYGSRIESIHALRSRSTC